MREPHLALRFVRLTHPRLPHNQRANARRLRRELTPAERILWAKLRSRRFEGYKFRRQHELGPYILDFYCHEARVAIELDGGHHAREEQKTYDRERREYIEAAGVREIRFWNNEVIENPEGVVTAVLHALG